MTKSVRVVFHWKQILKIFGNCRKQFLMSCFNIYLQKRSSFKRVPLIKENIYNIYFTLNVICVLKRKEVILKLACLSSTYKMPCSKLRKTSHNCGQNFVGIVDFLHKMM